MSYYKILGFDKEPFSTSPDPEFFYLSKEHEAALNNVLIDLRLKRGLSVVLGDIGTGKTTLSRKLIQELKVRDDFIFHFILDPSFENEATFLRSLLRNLDIECETWPAGAEPTIMDMRESLEKFLFLKGVTENKTVTLIIDEAQKLNDSSLEVLRVFLNYETNNFKLFQIVLLGQLELHAKIVAIPNFLDRISFKFTLNPLDFDETRKIIEFRVRQAGYTSNMRVFSDDAIREIHQYSKGYPRRIIMLCHKALKRLLLTSKIVVDSELIHELIDEEKQSGWYRESLLPQKNSC